MRISEKEEDDEGKPKTVVVAIKMDAESRELLTWALVKVADAGDLVVALHVISSTSDHGRSSLVSLVKAFDSVLAVYDGFCNLKQVDLKLKLCRGSSVRKILVRETKSYLASNLVVGINKHSHHIRSSTSTAKYCSKKLPKDCSVLAVSNGKIVFHRESIANRISSKTQNKKHGNYDYLSPVKDHQTKIWNASRISFHWLPEASNAQLTYSSTDHDDSKDLGSSVCSPIYSPSCPSRLTEGRDQDCTISYKDESLALVPFKKPNSMAVLNKKKINSYENPKVSIVQWVMRLPSRCTAALAIHSDYNHTSFDGEDQAIVPMRRTDSCSSLAICEKLSFLEDKYSSKCRLFSYNELKDATSNFSSENLIGRGGSSLVYRGCLSDSEELAVKVLKPSADVLKEFVSEIEIITTLHHNNIISLLGFCFENDNFILVYDFLSRGSLEGILHGNKRNKEALSWVERYKIALGVAEALDYLHGSSTVKRVIHRDVKSSNILLPDDFIPKLADFGLALWAISSSPYMTCDDVAGTFGYLAPEYFMYGKVTEKIDVYAFGVVLLELLSGRKPVNAQCPKGEESLVMWAKKNLQEGKMKELMDPCLGDEHDIDQLERMILAASICIRQDPRSRPRIALVKKLLQGDPDVLKWARSRDNFEEDFDALDDESPNSNSDIQSHINLALLDVEDDSLSISSAVPSVDFITINTSLEDYLKGRCSHSSSFN